MLWGALQAPRNRFSRLFGQAQGNLKQSLKKPLGFFGKVSVFNALTPHFSLKEIRRQPDNLS